jgi:hypothetical protein
VFQELNSWSFRRAACFTLCSIAMATPCANTGEIERTALERLQNQYNRLKETCGEEQAERIITDILNSEIEFLENSTATPASAAMALRLKSAFETESL